jgi:uncharacterized membrane protein
MVRKLSAWVRHMILAPLGWRRAFPPAVLGQIENAIAASEKEHGGEIRFAVEGSLPGAALWRKMEPRERAVRVFSDLRVWDTEKNTGVLIYVLWADRDVEILADRGYNALVHPGEWEAVCAAMEAHFREGRFKSGALAGVEGVTRVIARHFPPEERNPNELPDRPVVL